jgi:hypothetical protein
MGVCTYRIPPSVVKGIGNLLQVTGVVLLVPYHSL